MIFCTVLIFKLLSIVFLLFFINRLLIALINKIRGIEVDTSLKDKKYSGPFYRTDQSKNNLKGITEHSTNKPFSHHYSSYSSLSEEVTYVNAVQAAAHITRSRLYDSRLNTTFDYTNSNYDSFYIEPTQPIHTSDYTTEIDQTKNTYINFDEGLLKEEIEIIKEEIQTSQKTISHDSPMIPLCVSYEERQFVKSLGASWCHNNRTWFWSFTKNREAVDKWLPRIYKISQASPYILPQLVPEPLW